MSADRLFQIVYLLLEQERMTAEALAAQLGVSIRTVYRDVEALSGAGGPVYTSQGKGGGVALMEGYVLDRAAFTEEEQRQLVAALQSVPGQESPQALTKLSALFRRREEDWLQVNLSRWGANHWDNEIFEQLKLAIVERRLIRFAYASSQGTTRTRKALPARLVYKGQGWYLQALDVDREDYRTFRLSRILSPTISEDVFRRKLNAPEIDPAGNIPPLFRVEAALKFAPGMAHRVYDEFDRSSVSVQKDGSLLVNVVFPEDQSLYGYLLSFGSGLEILAPGSLRREVAALAEQISAVHSR